MFDLSPHLATSEIIFAWSRYDKNVNFTLIGFGHQMTMIEVECCDELKWIGDLIFISHS